MSKRKVFRSIFKLSFVPYAVLLLISLYHAIAGYDVYTWIFPQYVRTIYGLEAFAESLFLNVLMLCFSFPVLPVLIVYQMVYIIISVVKRVKWKKA